MSMTIFRKLGAIPAAAIRKFLRAPMNRYLSTLCAMSQTARQISIFSSA
jgi:hypothetical protein